MEDKVPPGTAQEFNDLMRRCNVKKPKPRDVQALRKCLAKRPELWRIAGDMSEVAVQSTIEGISATPLVIESIKAGRLAMRKELGFDAVSPLGKMLIDHVVLCWLRLQLIEYRYSDVMSQNITLTLGQYWEKRLSAAQRRYLRACETWARIQRLALPTLQVNIAEKQINVAQ